MRGVDTFQAFPLLVVAIALVSLAGNRLSMVAVAIALIFAPVFIRLVRSEALAIREARYIEAAHAIGATRKRVVLKHILPNVTGIILVQAAITASLSLNRYLCALVPRGWGLASDRELGSHDPDGLREYCVRPMVGRGFPRTCCLSLRVSVSRAWRRAQRCIEAWHSWITWKHRRRWDVV